MRGVGAKVARGGVLLTSSRLGVKLILPVSAFMTVFMIGLETSSASQIEELPKGCLHETSGPCAVRTASDQHYVLEHSLGVVVLDRDTVILRLPDGVRLVQGAVWVRPKKALSVQTEFGKAQSKHGEFWVTRDSLRMTVRASGEDFVEIHPRGVSSATSAAIVIGVEPGFENWIGKVGRSGQARVGLPSAIDLKDHLSRWGRLFVGTKVGSKKQFKTEVEKFHVLWREASSKSADYHKGLFDRKIASVQEAKAQQESARKNRQARDRELTDLFRRKVFEE